MFQTTVYLFLCFLCFCTNLRHSHILLLMLSNVVVVVVVVDDDVLTDSDCCVFDFEDINECDTGNNTCTTAQVCFNFQGGYTCLDPLQCHLPYIEVSDK